MSSGVGKETYTASIGTGYELFKEGCLSLCLIWSVCDLPSFHHLEQNNVGTLGQVNTGRAEEFSTLIRFAFSELSPVSCLAIYSGKSEGVR